MHIFFSKKSYVYFTSIILRLKSRMEHQNVLRYFFFYDYVTTTFSELLFFIFNNIYLFPLLCKNISKNRKFRIT